MPRIEKWSIGSAYFNPYQAPELQKKYLYGEIYDDEKGRFENGTYISTSSIQELDLENNVAETKNTTYILGKPSEDYLKWLKDNNFTLGQFING